QEKKIFAVQGSCPIIRRLLRARGWVERKLPSTGRVGSRPEQRPGSQEWQLLEEEEDEGGDGAEHGSCLVRDQVPYFIWSSRCRAIDGRLLQQDQVLNHYSRVGAFTTKVGAWTPGGWCDRVGGVQRGLPCFSIQEGLCLNLRNLPWLDQADPDTFFPRCYRLGAADERQAFIEDFRLTAARSLLKVALERAGDTPAGTEQPPKSGEGLGEVAQWVPKSHVPHPMPPTAGQGPPLPPQLVEEALQLCEQHLGSLGHQDIDGDPPAPRMTSADWDRFLRDYYCLVHEGSVLVLSGAQRERGRALLQQLGEQLPQLAMEGDHNVWILKPSAMSRGRGIVCSARLEEVLQLAGGCAGPSVPGRGWVVQKYVERLLLIFGTKFDIRQWFLVTDWNPLTVWFYRESYVRFCSRPFSLHRLDRSVPPTTAGPPPQSTLLTHPRSPHASARHLCNVSIQQRCSAARGWHPRLPPDHIWSCRQLQAYLAQVGLGGAWHQVMVPGMKAAVVGALRSAQELVGSRKGSFELYGVDFVFGEDCQPWLLEINTSPTMAPSSAVTRRLCARVQRDTLRVVIDRRADPTCPTGAFELIYKE
ncbi:TTLL3 monoglycylase, partial [Pterocles burchelli]|nr:TTLL3 monoglycylase [Pterocles burchelli]